LDFRASEKTVVTEKSETICRPKSVQRSGAKTPPVAGVGEIKLTVKNGSS